MIDAAKLNALSLDTLKELERNVKLVIANKMRSEIRHGSIVTFFSSKRGRNVRLSVTGFGPKNLSGYEITPSGDHMHTMKWRVHPSLVQIEAAPVIGPAVLLGMGGDRPKSAAAAY
jgi:hypothetical protein